MSTPACVLQRDWCCVLCDEGIPDGQGNVYYETGPCAPRRRAARRFVAPVTFINESGSGSIDEVSITLHAGDPVHGYDGGDGLLFLVGYAADPDGDPVPVWSHDHTGPTDLIAWRHGDYSPVRVVHP